MTAAYALDAPTEDLVAAYLRDLAETGLQPGPSSVGSARGFFARFPTPEEFARRRLDEQLALPPHLRRVVNWLLVTGRMTATADYLAATRLRLGASAARHHPRFHATFSALASELGSDDEWVRRQWTALTQICALYGTAPDQITKQHLDEGGVALLGALRCRGTEQAGQHLRGAMFRLEATLFHAGVVDTPPLHTRPDQSSARAAQWEQVAAGFARTARRYLDQIALSLRRATVAEAERSLRELGLFLADSAPDVRCIADIRRHHIEAYKSWLAERPSTRGGQLHRHSIGLRLRSLRAFLERVTEWGYDDAPARVLMFAGDLPVRDQPLPRFLDDAASAKLLRAARADPDPFVRLVVEFLARTGLRKGELINLAVDAVVQIGTSLWLRVPVGKLHEDRYIPLHPQLKELLDDWLARRPPGLRSDLVFIERGRRIPAARIDRAVSKAARTAGLGRVTPHQLRHTLATQAINRGMSLEAIAALLGHRSMAMTMVYARIADRTVADEYFAVSDKVEALYDHTAPLPADAEGRKMARLRREMHERMLGNGYCARPPELDCHFESICESCTFFRTTIDFLPVLQRQRDHAATKGQTARRSLFDHIITTLEDRAS